MRLSWWLLTSLVFATASCGTAGYAGAKPRLAAPADGMTASPQPQPDVRFAATEGVAVTGGLSGKFFSNNQDGDVRARAEQLFSYAVADGPGAGGDGAEEGGVCGPRGDWDGWGRRS